MIFVSTTRMFLPQYSQLSYILKFVKPVSEKYKDDKIANTIHVHAIILGYVPCQVQYKINLVQHGAHSVLMLYVRGCDTNCLNIFACCLFNLNNLNK